MYPTVITLMCPSGRPSDSAEIFDARGRFVSRLLDAEQPAGARSLTWDASSVARGVYFARLQSADAATPNGMTRKITLTR